MTAKPGLGDFKKLLESAGGLPELGSGPRAGVVPLTTLDASLQSLLAGGKLSADKQALIRALILLWHDHSDAAHVLAQEIENPDGSFVHGIIHRREPDYGNADYWFRRVGAHPAYPTIATRAGELLASKNQAAFQKELIHEGRWDPFAFIHHCKKAFAKPGSPQTDLLRQIQAIETEALLEYFLAG